MYFVNRKRRFEKKKSLQKVQIEKGFKLITLVIASIKIACVIIRSTINDKKKCFISRKKFCFHKCLFKIFLNITKECFKKVTHKFRKSRVFKKSRATVNKPGPGRIRTTNLGILKQVCYLYARCAERLIEFEFALRENETRLHFHRREQSYHAKKV